MPMSSPAESGRTQAERSRATTEQLVDAARELFAARGYDATSIDAVVAHVGVTKGALYHHFSGKRDLFAAVFEREQQHLAEAIVAAFSRRKDPWAGFYDGCKAFFHASLNREVQRITLLDAPLALGFDGMRAVENRYSLALLKAGIAAAIDAGRIRDRPVDPLAHLLFGALCETAMVVARAADPEAEMRCALRELKLLLDALAVA